MKNSCTYLPQWFTTYNIDRFISFHIKQAKVSNEMIPNMSDNEWQFELISFHIW